jgi:hypothetical protein
MDTSVNVSVAVSVSYGDYAQNTPGARKPSAARPEENTADYVGVAATVEISSKAEENIKNQPVDREKVIKLLEESKKQNEAFVEMIKKLFTKQAQQDGLSGWNAALPDKNLADFFANLKPDQETIDKAKEAISEDGYYGVNKTAGRIMDFAKAVAGNDPEKIESMRAAVQKGFDQAERMWGKKLPEISQQTYEKVMKEFGDWLDGAKASGGAASEFSQQAAVAGIAGTANA